MLVNSGDSVIVLGIEGLIVSKDLIVESNDEYRLDFECSVDSSNLVMFADC